MRFKFVGSERLEHREIGEIWIKRKVGKDRKLYKQKGWQSQRNRDAGKDDKHKICKDRKQDKQRCWQR